MFSLHETTKTHLCRVAFIALCVVPTCAVLAWCIFTRLPSYRQAHERAIAAQLGLVVQLAKVSSPEPGLVLYEGLELFDPESRKLLGRLPFVECETSGTSVSIKLPFPAMVNGVRLDAFWKLAHDQLREPRSWRTLRLEAENLTLHLSDGTLTDLHALVEDSNDEARLDVSFRVATSGAQPADVTQLKVVRNRRATPPTSVVEFTSPTPLPCNLVASAWPTVQRLGRASTFAGRILAFEQNDQWKAELTGTLAELDLGLLVSPFRHKLSGTAQAELKLVAIEQGRIERAVGTIDAGPGVISGSLIHSAQTHLRFTAVPQVLAGRDNLLAYEHLSIAFEMNAQGIALHGGWPAAPGVVLIDAKRRVLVREPDVAVQSVLNLARTLVPDADLQVPATRETGGLTNALPVPSATPPAGDERQLPHVNALRLGTRRQ